MPESDSVEPADARRALDSVDAVASEADASVEAVGDGVNDVFVVDPEDGGRLVVKFGTFSDPAHFRAGVAAYRLLSVHTDLPVPTVHAAVLDDESLPPFLVMEHRPGERLADGFDDTERTTAPRAVRALGGVLAACGAVPDEATTGYGTIRELADGDRPRAVAPYDTCADWFLDYAARGYADPPDHERLRSVAGRVLPFLRSNRERFPDGPSSSLVVTDVSPENLLAPGGVPPADIEGLTGVIDLERAKVGPLAFAAVNAEYLLTRDVADPEPVRETLYDPLPFGPDVAARDLYRVMAMGREVGALAFWHEPGSERFERRGDAIAAELETILA